jgi:hypothetical protein
MEALRPLSNERVQRRDLGRSRYQHSVAGSSVPFVAAPSVKEMDFFPYNE